jgi:hypothetical protein
MTNQEMFLIIRLLSAMESAMFVAKVPMPEHLSQQIIEAIASLQDAILQGQT